MDFFQIQRNILFMKYAIVFNTISIITFIIAIFCLYQHGLNFSIEFTGGIAIEIHSIQSIKPDLIRDTLKNNGYYYAQVQNFGASNDILIRLPIYISKTNSDKHIINPFKQANNIINILKSQFPLIKIQKVDSIGPQIGGELSKYTIFSIIFVILCIFSYLTLRFGWKYAVAGIIANLHDVIIIFGFFSYFQWEFSLSVLAAILSVLGYSINESIVIFDRIRELFSKKYSISNVSIINHAINSTISRTIITHLNTEAMVLSILFFGGITLHYFALALTIGILFGIYSSVFVAASIAMWLDIKRDNNGNIPQSSIENNNRYNPDIGAQI